MKYEINKPILPLTVLLIVAIINNNFSNVDCLKNGLALTPPMGWLAWERFTCEIDCVNNREDCIDKQLFTTMANRLSYDGYRAVGYNYINIDDCWSTLKRDVNTSQLIPDPDRFGGSDGMKELSEYLHKEQLLLGIYGDCGTETCAGYPAQLKNEYDLEDNYFDIDAKTFFDWQIDSFKFDGCNIDPFVAESICPKMTKAIEAQKRSVLITCEWPFYMLRTDPSRPVNWTLAQESCNIWRYFEDVEDSWASILSIIDYTVKLQNDIRKYHGPGSWFDPDQLVIGNFGLSLEQARAQMAIWSIWAAPLFMSNDLRKIKPEMAAVLKNKNLIDVDQDRLGVFGLMVKEEGEGNDKFQAFVKPIELIKNGCPSFAIVYLNRQVLGNGKLVSFELRQLLTTSSIHMAGVRYKQLYGQDRPAGEFIGSQCLTKLNSAMTVIDQNKLDRDSLLVSNINQQNVVPIEEQQIFYEVYDLITSEYLGKVGLDSKLELWVNPSAVRAVKLTEWTPPSVEGTSSQKGNN